MNIALDFDRTLAEYHGGKNAVFSVGKPIPEMVKKVKGWVAAGHNITIFTARVAPVGKNGPRDAAFIQNQGKMIQNFLQEVGLPAFQVTAIKFPHFDVFVDDKAVAVEANTGKILSTHISLDD